MSSYEKYAEFFENISEKYTNIFSSEVLRRKEFSDFYVFERLKLVANKKN